MILENLLIANLLSLTIQLKLLMKQQSASAESWLRFWQQVTQVHRLQSLFKRWLLLYSQLTQLCFDLLHFGIPVLFKDDPFLFELLPKFFHLLLFQGNSSISGDLLSNTLL